VAERLTVRGKCDDVREFSRPERGPDISHQNQYPDSPRPYGPGRFASWGKDISIKWKNRIKRCYRAFFRWSSIIV
jgi:hypothetical protein